MEVVHKPGSLLQKRASVPMGLKLFFVRSGRMSKLEQSLDAASATY